MMLNAYSTVSTLILFLFKAHSISQTEQNQLDSCITSENNW